MSHVVRNGGEDAKLRIEVLIHGHNRGYVAATVTIIGGGPDRDNGVLGEMIL